MNNGYRKQWQVEVNIPIRVVERDLSIERQCRNFNEGHSVNGDIDCFPESLEWDGYELLSLTLTLKSSLKISKEQACDEAVAFWDTFSKLWLADWFTALCGQADVLLVTKI